MSVNEQIRAASDGLQSAVRENDVEGVINFTGILIGRYRVPWFVIGVLLATAGGAAVSQA